MTQSVMLDELIQRVIVPYTILGILLLLAGIVIRYSVLPEINTDEQNATDDKEAVIVIRKTFLVFHTLF